MSLSSTPSGVMSCGSAKRWKRFARKSFTEIEVRAARGAAGQGLLHKVADFGDLVDAHERIDFGQQLGQLVAEALGQAARHDQRLARPARLPKLVGLQNRIDAFLLGVLDKGAGVDDHDIRRRGVVDDFHARLQQRAEHDFRIDQVFGATQRDHPNAHRALNVFHVHPKPRQLTQRMSRSNGRVEGLKR